MFPISTSGSTAIAYIFAIGGCGGDVLASPEIGSVGMVDIEMAIEALTRAWLTATIASIWVFALLALSHVDSAAYLGDLQDTLARAG